MSSEDQKSSNFAVSRREFVGVAVAGSAATLVSVEQVAAEPAQTPNFAQQAVSLTINQQKHQLTVDPRTTLLDLLRENLQVTGTKKGCDHGQCGACTVLVNGTRVNSCLTFAVMHDGHEITTIEGLAQGNRLHPMQSAFIEHDGFQCGYCTPGQICSAVAMLEEWKSGAPSSVSQNLSEEGPVHLTDDEIRERMSGNICRCGAYLGIVAAVRQVHEESRA